MTPFNFKIENLELRSCDYQLLCDSGKEHETAEIVKWVHNDNDTKYCFTVAYWIKNKEYFDLNFCQSRPFDVNMELFMFLAKTGQQALEQNI